MVQEARVAEAGLSYRASFVDADLPIANVHPRALRLDFRVLRTPGLQPRGSVRGHVAVLLALPSASDCGASVELSSADHWTRRRRGPRPRSIGSRLCLQKFWSTILHFSESHSMERWRS